MAHDRKFRFGVQASSASSASDWREQRPQDRGPRVLDAVHARPLHRHAARADGRRSRSRPRRRRRCASARSCSATTTSTRRSSPRRPRRSTSCPTAGSSSGIGAGWMTVDYDALGMPLRLGRACASTRLEEALAVIKGCFAGDGRSTSPASTTRSPTTTRSRSRCSSRARRSSSAAGRRKVLRLAGREADIVGINPNLRTGAVTADAVESSLAGDDAAEDRVDPRGRGRPVRRHRAADPLLRRVRSPTTPSAWPRSIGAAVRASAPRTR